MKVKSVLILKVLKIEQNVYLNGHDDYHDASDGEAEGLEELLHMFVAAAVGIGDGAGGGGTAGGGQGSAHI